MLLCAYLYLPKRYFLLASITRFVLLGFVTTILTILLILPVAYAGTEAKTLINSLHQKEARRDKPLAAGRATQVGSLAFKTRDGVLTTQLKGRLQLDATRYSGHHNMDGGTEARRAYLTLQGTIHDDWGYRWQYDFANTGPNGKGILDSYIEYLGFNSVNLRLGNFKEPFTLHEKTSDNFVTFTERALLAAFSPGRRLGAMTSHGGKNWTWAVGLFDESIANKKGSVDGGWGASGRMTYAPINEAGQLVHLGAGANYRDANVVRFKQTPETHIAGVNIVDTGTILATKNVVKLGAEFAAVFGSFSAQAEYILTSVNRSDGSNLVFDGWYVETACFITGESRQYKYGKFAKPLPQPKVGQDGVGAWQLALRYSTLDLNDGLIEGGETDAMTLGLNWFPTPTLRFTANYIDVLDTDGGANDGLAPSFFQLRSQWVF